MTKPNAKPRSTSKRNSPRDTRKGADCESGVINAPLEKDKAKAVYTERCSIRIEVIRNRLTDPDGNFTKWHLDSIVYSNIVADDSAKDIELQVTQRKAAKGEQERTIITIKPI